MAVVDICVSPDNDIADDKLDHRTSANRSGFCLNSPISRDRSLSVSRITAPAK
jgi:hypothetical protein